MKEEVKLLARDLRIGNWINTLEGDVQVTAMGEDGRMTTKIMNSGDYLGFAEPIPLTEEWLTMLGFELIGKRLTERRYRNKEVIVIIDVHGRKPHHIERIWCTECYYEIKFVHQIQNIYWAVMGRDL